MSLEGGNLLSFQRVPNVATVVIITGKQKSTTEGKGKRGNTAEDRFVGVLNQFLVSSDVKKSARSVVRASTESVAVREKVDCVDVRFMALESLKAFGGSDIPQFGSCIAGTGNKCILVLGVDGDAHNITIMVAELGDLRSSFDIPQNTGHISRTGDDLLV